MGVSQWFLFKSKRLIRLSVKVRSDPGPRRLNVGRFQGLQPSLYLGGTFVRLHGHAPQYNWGVGNMRTRGCGNVKFVCLVQKAVNEKV